jgi:hypothetical protein
MNKRMVQGTRQAAEEKRSNDKSNLKFEPVFDQQTTDN